MPGRLHRNTQLAYYFVEGIAPYFGTIPVIFSGHVTAKHPNNFGHAVEQGRILLDRAHSGGINLIFIDRHPLDAALSGWQAFRNLYLRHGSDATIARSYSSEEAFAKTVEENLYEFALFLASGKEFTRLTNKASETTSNLSLTEFLDETEIFLQHPGVHAFRFESFAANPQQEFLNLLDIIAPRVDTGNVQVLPPLVKESRYQKLQKSLPAFRSLIASLPKDLVSRIERNGYLV